MGIDIAAVFDDCGALAERAPNTLARGLTGSVILDIAAEVNALKAEGAAIANFTIGDFDPSQFPIPAELTRELVSQLEAGNTNYPPAVGVAELRKAVRELYSRELGLDYPEGSVQVGSGARPPIYAAFASVVEPGDTVVYPVPSWNNRYYAYLNGARDVPVTTRPENGFMPTAEDLAPYIREARIICLNSPQNPSGTVIREDLLHDVCRAILAENARRDAAGERPLFLLYDQVYWQLTFDRTHYTPVSLEPEMAKYTIFVDAISKCWAATGLRVGWAVVPPWIRGRMQPLIGHMGAWAAKPEQLATAALLRDPERVAPFMRDFKVAVRARLDQLHKGLQAMKADGLPVESIEPQGAIYLTAKVDLHGRPLADGTVLDEEGVRKLLLRRAGIAVVPFSAFGYPEGSGWMRFSVGAVSEADIDAALTRLRALLGEVLA